MEFIFTVLLEHEEYILMRIRNVCKGGVDAVIDFVSSARTVKRSTNVLREVRLRLRSALCLNVKKVKLAHTRLPSVGFLSRSRFLAVSLQVM